MLRYSLRLLLLLVVALVLGSIIYLDSSLLSYTPYKAAHKPPPPPSAAAPASSPPPADTAPISPTHYTTNSRILTPAHTELKLQWRFWSAQIYAHRPTVPPLTPHGAAVTVNGQHRAGPRRPAGSRLRLKPATIASLQASHAAFLSSIHASAPPQVAATLYNGSGVVLVAGGEFFGPAIVSLRMLRRTGCTLPAEVFLGTSAEYEPDVCEGVLPLLNARCVVIPDLFTTSVYVSVSRYQLKALALLFSSFAQVVFMDSDSIPLLDPTPLLSSAPFTDTGLVLWPDFWTATEDPAFWTIAGLGTEFPADLPATSSEAGQILIDKHRQLHALLLAVYYNVHGPDHYYPLLSQGALGQGDKETFLAAAVAAKAPWYRVRAPVLAVGYERRDGTLKGAGMAQAHPGDDLRVNGGGGGVAGVATREGVRTAWVHVNTPKMNAGHLVDEGDLVGEDGKRVRLLGSREKQVQLFGEDVERVLWEIMVDSGCELAMVVKEWVGRERMCERLKEHWEAVFEHHGK